MLLSELRIRVDYQTVQLIVSTEPVLTLAYITSRLGIFCFGMFCSFVCLLVLTFTLHLLSDYERIREIVDTWLYCSNNEVQHNVHDEDTSNFI